MSELEEFLADTLPRFHAAETALHSGDAAPRRDMWSRKDPVTLFGAAISGRGWSEIDPIFDGLGKSFSDCTSYENEVVAAEVSGDLGYVVALEHTTCSIKGAEPQPYVLRVTTIYRRESGVWRIVHRHGDALADQASGQSVRRLVGSES